MSGDHYDCRTLAVLWLADEIEGDIERISTDSAPDDLGYVRKAEPPEILEAMRQCVADLRAVGERAKAIEWYLSGDYGPETLLLATNKGSTE